MQHPVVLGTFLALLGAWRCFVIGPLIGGHPFAEQLLSGQACCATGRLAGVSMLLQMSVDLDLCAG